MNSPDLIYPIVGFRRWRIYSGLLLSPFRGDVWQPGPRQARCTHEAPIPKKECSCGWYAYHYPKGFPKQEKVGSLGIEVAGVVQMWGAIEAYNEGLRSEWVSLKCLALPKNCPTSIRRQIYEIAYQQDVPLVPSFQIMEKSREWGETLPASCLPL